MGGAPPALRACAASLHAASIPVAVAHCLVRSLFHAHVRAGRHLWRVLRGRAALPSLGRAMVRSVWRRSTVESREGRGARSEARASKPCRQGAEWSDAGGPGLRQVTSSILLLMPLILLLPTVTTFYASTLVAQAALSAVQALAWYAARCVDGVCCTNDVVGRRILTVHVGDQSRRAVPGVRVWSSTARIAECRCW